MWLWKSLACLGFPDYEVSEIGQVRRKGIVIATDYNNTGYLRNNLWKENIQHHYLNHRLVAIVWVPNPLLKPIVNHDDRIIHNNYWRNLRWMTYKENSRYREEMKRLDREQMKKETPF